MIESLAGFGILLVLILLRLPIAFAMALVGFVGCLTIIGLDPTFSIFGQVVIDTSFSYEFSILPLFILMGNLISRSRISDELYDACYAFLGHFRGGLAMATIMACAGFSAVSGSSLATVATISKVAVDPMRKRGYSDRLIAGSVTAGSTVGILIPPSVILVVYGIMTETNIGDLFIAGVIPGLLAVLLYLTVVIVTVWLNPRLGPAGSRTEWRARLRLFSKVWTVAALFLIIIGGIYGGVFTATEAAGIGATVAFFIAWLRGRLSVAVLKQVFHETIMNTAMIFAVLIGALIFADFVNLSGLPGELTAWVQATGMGPYAVLLVIFFIYLVLGCALDSMAMVLLTVPIFFPMVMAYGFDPIWFGVIVVVVTEISLLTPPVGMNVFVFRSAVKDIPTGTIFAGVTPFLFIDFVRLGVLTAFPVITLWLPSMMWR